MRLRPVFTALPQPYIISPCAQRVSVILALIKPRCFFFSVYLLLASRFHCFLFPSVSRLYVSSLRCSSSFLYFPRKIILLESVNNESLAFSSNDFSHDVLINGNVCEKFSIIKLLKYKSQDFWTVAHV